MRDEKYDECLASRNLTLHRGCYHEKWMLVKPIQPYMWKESRWSVDGRKIEDAMELRGTDNVGYIFYVAKTD